MANIKSAMKRARQDHKRRTRNRYFKTTSRTYIKRAKTQIEAGELETAQENIRLAIKALDKAAQRGVIHKNNASRRKSRLMKALNKAKVAG